MLLFLIEGRKLWIKFVVCQRLGGDDIILGRDFMRMYDVLVDIPRGEMVIRNPAL